MSKTKAKNVTKLENSRDNNEKLENYNESKYISRTNCAFSCFNYFKYFCTLLALLQAAFYSYYLYKYHENELWFSQITELEREISFRTEQGLYYNNFKILVNEKSFKKGLEHLINDDKTEFPHVINLIKRFNIYQEIVLAVIYKYAIFPCGKLFNLNPLNIVSQPILFYTYSIFLLQSLESFSIYLIANFLTGGNFPIASLLAQLNLLSLKIDTTRVERTVPLREHFAIPFLFYQMYLVSKFLSTNTKIENSKLSKNLGILVSTFVFSICWQFNQFILLLEIVPIFGLYLLNLIPSQKLKTMAEVFLLVLSSIFILQIFNPMIPRGLITAVSISILVHLQLSNISPKFLQKFKIDFKKDSIFGRIFKIFLNLMVVGLVSWAINFGLKLYFHSDDDTHIFKFLTAKLSSPKYCTDFDANLYICNGAFMFLDLETYKRILTSGGLGCFYFIGVIWYLYEIFNYILNVKADINGKFTISLPKIEYIYIYGQSILFLIMAAIVLRMKFLFTPFVGILAVVIYSKIHEKCKWIYYIFLIMSFSQILYVRVPEWKNNFNSLGQFRDADTVQFLKFINSNTDKKSVFSGTMQVMSMIKLSTNRAITNHPHYEDKNLRLTTFDVYQIYSRKSTKQVHEILKKHGTTHIVVENSICYARENVGKTDRQKYCATKSILDRSNLHINMSTYAFIDNLPKRFCAQILEQHNTPIEFTKVFENKTFRIYRLN